MLRGGARDRLVDALAHARRELVAPPADDDAHAAPVHLVDLALHRLVEQAHQGPHLGPRAGPVLGREGVDGQDLDAQLLAAFEHALDRADAGAVAEAGGPARGGGPSGRCRP